MDLLRTTAVLAVLVMVSCSTDGASSEDQHPLPVITGKVMDPDDDPIEHIKVTLEWSSAQEALETYTSSEGEFRSEIILPENEGSPITITLTLEDIDGEANGGLFEKHTESFLLETQSTQDPPITLDREFRLNRATDEESNPQS